MAGAPQGDRIRLTGRLSFHTAAVSWSRRLPLFLVEPYWQGGNRDEEHLLASAYRHSLREARRSDERTVAFPSISTGIYAYPVQEAARVALRTVIDELKAHPGALDEVTAQTQ